MPISASEHAKRLRNYAKDLEDTVPYFNAVVNVVREQGIRVFENGGVGANGSTQEYEGGALYVNPDKNKGQSPRQFPTVGKTGQNKFKNGKAHKTGFFDSYSQFKRTIGQKSNVNLVLFGNLQSIFAAGIFVKKTNQGTSVFHSLPISAFNPEGKLKGLINKYPNAFRPTAKEIEDYVIDLSNYQKDLIKKNGL